MKSVSIKLIHTNRWIMIVELCTDLVITFCALERMVATLEYCRLYQVVPTNAHTWLDCPTIHHVVQT